MPFFCKRKLRAVKTIHRKEYRNLLESLATARKEKAITQQDLAKKLKKPQSYVSKIENGERRMDVIEFLEICEAMSVDYRKILGS